MRRFGRLPTQLRRGWHRCLHQTAFNRAGCDVPAARAWARRRATDQTAESGFKSHLPGVQCPAWNQPGVGGFNSGRGSCFCINLLLVVYHDLTIQRFKFSHVPSTLQPLTSVALGTTATVAEIKLPPESRPRLMEMGLLVGTPVELVRFAPLGDPVEIRVRGYNLTLRKHEAEQIFVRAEA